MQRTHEENKIKSSEFKSEMNSESDLKIAQNMYLLTARRACRQTAQHPTLGLPLSTAMGACQQTEPQLSTGINSCRQSYNSTLYMCIQLSALDGSLSTMILYFSLLLLLLMPSVWVKKSYQLDFYPLFLQFSTIFYLGKDFSNLSRTQ